MAASAPGRRRRPWRWFRRASAAWRGTTGVSSSPTSGAPQRRSKTAATPRSGSTCAWVRRDGRDARGRQGGRRRFGPGVWAQFRGRGDLPGVGGGGEGGSGSGPRAARRRSPAGHGSPHGGGVDDHAPRGAEAAAIPQEPCFFRSGPSPAPSSCSGSGLDFSSGSGSRGHGTAGRAKGPQKKRRKWAGAARRRGTPTRPPAALLPLPCASLPPSSLRLNPFSHCHLPLAGTWRTAAARPLVRPAQGPATVGAAGLSGASSKAAAAHNSNWVPQSLSSEMKALAVRPPRLCCPPALRLPPPLSFSSSFNSARLGPYPQRRCRLTHAAPRPPTPHPPARPRRRRPWRPT